MAPRVSSACNNVPLSQSNFNTGFNSSNDFGYTWPSFNAKGARAQERFDAAPPDVQASIRFADKKEWEEKQKKYGWETSFIYKSGVALYERGARVAGDAAMSAKALEEQSVQYFRQTYEAGRAYAASTLQKLTDPRNYHVGPPYGEAARVDHAKADRNAKIAARPFVSRYKVKDLVRRVGADWTVELGVGVDEEENASDLVIAMRDSGHFSPEMADLAFRTGRLLKEPHDIALLEFSEELASSHWFCTALKFHGDRCKGLETEAERSAHEKSGELIGQTVTRIRNKLLEYAKVAPLTNDSTMEMMNSLLLYDESISLAPPKIQEEFAPLLRAAWNAVKIHFDLMYETQTARDQSMIARIERELLKANGVKHFIWVGMGHKDVTNWLLNNPEIKSMILTQNSIHGLPPISGDLANTALRAKIATRVNILSREKQEL